MPKSRYLLHEHGIANLDHDRRVRLLTIKTARALIQKLQGGFKLSRRRSLRLIEGKGAERGTGFGHTNLAERYLLPILGFDDHTARKRRFFKRFVGGDQDVFAGDASVQMLTKTILHLGVMAGEIEGDPIGQGPIFGIGMIDMVDIAQFLAVGQSDDALWRQT